LSDQARECGDIFVGLTFFDSDASDDRGALHR